MSRSILSAGGIIPQFVEVVAILFPLGHKDSSGQFSGYVEGMRGGSPAFLPCAALHVEPAPTF